MTRRLVVMAASAGGIEALQTVLRELSPDFDAPVLVVLHMAAGGGGALPGILNRAGPLRATAAVDGEQLSAGHVYVCVADNHLLVGEGHLHVRRGPRENGHRPAADPLFRSAALNVRVWNGLSFEMWGLRPEEVEGKAFLTLDIGFPVELLGGPLRQALADNHTTEGIEVAATTRRGHTVRCRATVSPLIGQSNTTDGAIILIRELTGGTADS
jgi:PAS domain-containing protein